MKYTDLMVGDLVSITTNIGTRYESTDIEVVTSVNEFGAITLFDGSGDGLYNESMEEVKIEPIPITDEILEKNGFRVTSEHADYYFEEDGEKMDFCMRRMYDKANPKVQRGWGHRTYNILSLIEYVHELQHLLKALRIDKQITL